MIRSMTGYGRAQEVRNGREITVEMRAVNNRFLDLTIKLPHVYSFAEDALKQVVRFAVQLDLLFDILCAHVKILSHKGDPAYRVSCCDRGLRRRAPHPHFA